MKRMPSPFDFQMAAKNNCSSVAGYFSGKKLFSSDASFGEPISVLDSRIPGGLTSSSTPASSLGGGSSDGGGAASPDTVGVAAVSGGNPSLKWQHDSTTATSSSAGGIESDLLPIPPSLADKCAVEDWESVLSESAAASPGKEQFGYRWIMADVEDPTEGTLNRFLQFGGSTAAAEFDFNGGFGVMDHPFAGENLGADFFSNLSNNYRSSSEKTSNPIKYHHNSQNPMHPSSVANNFGAVSTHHPAAFSSPPPFFPPFSYAHEQAVPPPPAKRLNSGGGQISRQQSNQQQQLQFLPQYLHHRPKMSCGAGDELQQAIIEELYKAAELLQAGNPSSAQGILARLNQHLSPTGKPFNRAAFYCKVALQLLLHPSAAAHSSPLSLLFKIGAYKSFSEISPLVDFANFTCNQALLEAVEGFERIHIVDFDIGYGGQWASLMQELALRSNGAPLLKITALVSPSNHDQLTLSLTRENLILFANEINIRLEFQFTSIDSLSSSWSAYSNEAVAVNIPVSCLADHQLPPPSVLGLVKQLSPKIVVSVERGSDRADLTVAGHVIHAVEACSSLLESLDAINADADALKKIESLLIQPEMEKLVMCRFRSPQKSQHWRTLFLNFGFSPLMFSNFAESQAEMVVKRSVNGGGFEVEKRHSSLLLCWRGKELLSASVWR